MAKHKTVIELRDGVVAVSGVAETPEGVAYGSPLSADRYAGLVLQHAPEAKNGNGGFFLTVPANVDAGRVFIRSVFDTPGKHTVQNVVIVGQGARIEIFYDMQAAEGAEVDETRTTAVADNGQVKMTEMYSGEGGLSVNNISVLQSGGRSETLSVSPVAQSITYGVDLCGVNASAEHAGLFLAAGEERVDYNVKVRHLVPDCHSDVLVKGLAADEAACSFTGMVYVAQDAQHTEAYQQSRNLLLSDAARIMTSPQLEIYADDVKCSHGATVGRQDGDAIYYMRQRGLSEEQARGLQLAGFVNEIVSRIDDEGLRERISGVAGEKMGITA